VEDLGAQSGALHCALATANIARATILSLNTEQAAAAPGVKLVLTAADLPHAKLWGTLIADEPLLADDQIHYNGQPIALIVADTRAHAEAAAARVHAEYAPLPPILTIDAAIKAGSYHGTAHTIQRGDVAQAIDAADHIITGTLLTPAQDHFYLETQATLASPDDNGDLTLLSSTQHPTEVQHLVSAVTGLPYHRVNCETPRMGGGFGGKESQAAPFAALAGLAAHTLGVPVLIRLNRHQDMVITGKRHTFHSQYRIGFSNAGKILGFQAMLTADGGHSTDLSPAILDRALFHLDNAYTIPALKFEGRVAKSNLPSATAFRGFGGPQGVAVIEEAINRFCEETGRDSAEVRHLNYYSDAQNITPYGQPINDCRLSTIHDQLLTSSGYTDRKKAIALFNATSPVIKRGIAYQPVKFGISFTVSMLNQAGALVVIYTDGSVQVNTGGTEMGQGLTTKMAVIAARSLGITDDRVRVMPTTTEKVPNTSPTAASSGTDLNGAAVRAAVATLLDRLRPVAAKMLNVAPSAITIADNVVSAGDQSIPFSALCKAAWAERVSLSATGFYATPGIAYDRDAGKGTPFRYFAYGGSVVEVELDGLTGEHRLRRVDILHDVGDSLAPEIDRGQVEGAFVQGLGWLTCEELLYNDDGRVLTAGPSTYKIPSFGDIPHNFRVDLLENATNDLAVMGSKAVGEPPFILAIGAVSALRQAIHAFAPTRGAVDLSLPATPEALLNAIYAHQTGE
jgi:xanthine dehydrogenase large subunit